MKTRIFITSVALTLLLSVATVYANGTVSETGKTGMSFLSITPTSKIAAMGGIASALTVGASSLWSNPALLTGQVERSAQFTHTEWIEGINQEFAAISGQSNIGALALGVQLFDSGDIEFNGGTQSVGSNSFYSIKNAAFTLSYARTVWDRLSAGVSYKKLFEKIFDETAGGYAIDAGLLYDAPVEGLSIALSTRNHGRMGMLKNERTQLPSDTVLGLAWNGMMPMLDLPMTSVADVVSPRYGDTGVRLGAELEPLEYLSCRIGYRSDSDIENVSFGLGLAMERFAADLSYTPMSEGFGSALRMTLSITGF